MDDEVQFLICLKNKGLRKVKNKTKQKRKTDDEVQFLICVLTDSFTPLADKEDQQPIGDRITTAAYVCACVCARGREKERERSDNDVSITTANTFKLSLLCFKIISHQAPVYFK